MSLGRLLDPASVAIVGASADPKKISGMMVDFLRRSGFAGRIYPINPRYESIHDWPCYPSVESLPEVVDVVVIVVPVAIAFESLEQAAARGVPFVVLMTGGFGEGTSGATGEARRDRLKALSARTGMRVLGPNTVGMVNFRGRLPLTFADWYGRDTGQRGGVAIVTHSGSVGGLIFSSLQASRVGVDYWIATGNEANLETADIIDHLCTDDGLHTIACFMEGVVDGRRFMAAAEQARAAGKHIVVLKAGESEASLRATVAHTTKRSTHPDVYRAVFRQLGVVQVRSLQELTYCVKLLSTVGDKVAGQVGVLSASGGACSLIADHVIESGLGLPELEPAIQTRLSASIPEYGSARNPVDLSADVVSRRDIVDGTFAALADDIAVDTWLVFGRPVIDRYHAEIGAFAQRSGKAVIVSSGVPLRPEIEQPLRDAGVPAMDDPQLCMRALGAIHRAGPTGPAGAKRREWIDEPRRMPATAQPDVVPIEALLRRHDLAPAGGAATRHDAAPEDLLVFSLVQDSDFGAILTLRRDAEGCARDPARTVRVMPVDNQDIDEMVAELSHSVRQPMAARNNDIARIARAVRDLYAGTATVFEVEVRATGHAGGTAIRHVTVSESVTR